LNLCSILPLFSAGFTAHPQRFVNPTPFVASIWVLIKSIYGMMAVVGRRLGRDYLAQHF